MIPYNFRRIMRRGIDTEKNRSMWGEQAWEIINLMTWDTLLRATPIDVSPIDHIFEKHSYPRRDIFPPWNTFYFECRHHYSEASKKEIIEKNYPIDPEGETMSTYGKLIVGGKIDEEQKTLILKKNPGMAEHFSEIQIGGYGFTVTGIVYENKMPFIEYILTFFTNKNGVPFVSRKMKEQVSRNGMEMDKELLTITIHTPENYIAYCSSLLGISGERIQKEIEDDALIDIAYLLDFIMFMQAKNVSIAPTQFPDFKPKKRKPRIKAMKYYELCVTKPSVNTGEGRHLSTIKGKALHSVRGHLAHYTKEKPLFGKYVGTFFIPQHVRGSLEYGRVEKTYKTKVRAMD